MFCCSSFSSSDLAAELPGTAMVVLSFEKEDTGSEVIVSKGGGEVLGRKKGSKLLIST